MIANASVLESRLVIKMLQDSKVDVLKINSEIEKEKEKEKEAKKE